jgi:hypothetical protein
MKKRTKNTAEKLVETGNKKVIQVISEDNKNFRECLNIVAGTKEGRYILSRLMERCSGNRSVLVLDANRDIDDNVLMVNLGKQAVWFDEIMKFISVVNLKKIMFFDRRKLCQTQKTIQNKM